MSIFREGRLLFFKVIPKGQADLTDAIASRFDIPVEIAEELKVGYGFISGPSDHRNQENIPVEWMGNNKNIPRGEINKVISERLGVIFNLISEEVKNFSGFKDIVKAGAVITGGCTYMEGFLEGATERLGFSVRQGTLNQVFGISAETYAVSLGLVKFGLQTREVIDGKTSGGLFKKVFHKANEILTDYF